MSDSVHLYVLSLENGTAISLDASGLEDEEGDLIVSATCLHCNARLSTDRYRKEDYMTKGPKELGEQITREATRAALQARAHRCVTH